VIVGGSNKALAFAFDSLGNPFDPQLASRAAISGQPIKLIVKIVEARVTLESDVFDVSIEGSGKESDECAHLLLALPTLRASHEMTAEARDTHLLSLSFGVSVATREATAMTLAAI
tara:strand:- start:177 stop:524 length:348 start_codon:yes stop_codon:yes gene_type:complete